MKIFPHGQGDGDSPTYYLVSKDYHGRDEHPPQVLRGDVTTTKNLIDSLETKWRFTAGVLSWRHKLNLFRHVVYETSLTKDLCALLTFYCYRFCFRRA